MISPMMKMKQIAVRLGSAHLNVLKQLEKLEHEPRAALIRRAIMEYAEKRGIRPETRSK
jgi:hypothetical protein